METANKVLIIDDEEILRDILIEVLQLNGIPTISASNGKEGIEYYNNNRDKIGVVLLDLIMPDENGIEIFRKLERINPSINVIFMSGISHKEEIENLNTFAEISFVAKPFSLEEIKSKVMQYLS